MLAYSPGHKFSNIMEFNIIIYVQKNEENIVSFAFPCRYNINKF